MKHRIFIAINFPQDTKKRMRNLQEKWAYLPVRWTKEASLHLTLVFIGYVRDEEIAEICRITKEVVQKYEPFSLEFNRVCLGPPNRPPRMIWIEGERNKELADLKSDLEKNLLNSGETAFNRVETRVFRPHATLARIRQFEWRKLSEKPKIDEKISITIPVNSIEVMESQLKQDGAEYIAFESVELSGSS